MSTVDQIKTLLSQCSEAEQRLVLAYLRQRFPIHPVERQLNTSAEVILEAIARASDLTLRGIRGIIAEAAFKENVISTLIGWEDRTPQGDVPYDFLLADHEGEVRIQVKLQRSEKGMPKLFPMKQGQVTFKYVVETQRTRSGRMKGSGKATRPYRFGEFDILAVSLHPSTSNWTDFVYTVADWLLPRHDDPSLLAVYQPVSKSPDTDWTDDLLTAVNWFRLRTRRTMTV